MVGRIPALAVAAILLVANAGFLKYLHTGLAFQASCVLVGLVLLFAGSVVLRPVKALTGDSIAFCAASFLCGMVLLTAVDTALFHRPVMTALGASSLAAAARIGLACLVLLSLVGLAVHRRDRFSKSGFSPGIGDPPAALGALALALFMSASTIYGLYNRVPESALSYVPADHPQRLEPRPEWGDSGDSLPQLIADPLRILQRQFPQESLNHTGAAVFLLGAVLPFYDVHEAHVVQACKVFTAAIWFALLYLFFVVARRVFFLRRGIAVLAMVSCALFAPINYPPLTLRTSSYLGLIGPTSAFYHNVTQLYSVGVGLAGICIAGLALRSRGDRWGLAMAAFFASGSFLFKPSFYTISAPALVLAWALERGRLRSGRLLTLVVLALPPLYWRLYLAVFDVESTLAGWQIDPFKVLFHWSSDRFPPWVQNCKLAHGSAILLFSFAAFMLPALHSCARGVGRLRDLPTPGRAEWLAHHRCEIFYWAIFALGMASGILFSESGKRFSHGNFLWASAAGYLAALPLFFRGIQASRLAWVRAASWLLVAVHIANGVVHLYLVAVERRIR